MGDRGFEIQVDDRDGGQIEGGMRTHQHPDSPGGREDRSECEHGLTPRHRRGRRTPTDSVDDGSLDSASRRAPRLRLVELAGRPA